MSIEEPKIYNRHNNWSGVCYDFLLYFPEKLLMRKWRKRLWQMVGNPLGRFLEIGVGTGNNFKYYPLNSELWAIDINPSMLARAKRKLKKSSVEVRLILADVEALPFEDQTFDTIVTTFVPVCIVTFKMTKNNT